MIRQPKPPALTTLALTALAVTPVLTHASATTMRAAAHPQEVESPAPPSADSMLGAWQQLAGGLAAEAVHKAGKAFEGDARLDWFYTPVQREGLPIGELDEAQRKRLDGFLVTGLGDGGLEKAFQIVELEEVLYEESDRSDFRNPGNYFLTTYGVPSTQGPWGWRFEGHHLSVNFTIIDNRIVSGTPAFFGGNPAHVGAEHGDDHGGLRPLGEEQDLGRRLVKSFAAEALGRVMIDTEAPSDVLTTNSRRAEMGAPAGLALGDMQEPQQNMLLDLLGLYAARMSSAVADHQMAKIRQSGIERLHFAWAGGTEPGEPHYYRIQGPTFVIEWDNTQNDANHVHSVWRDFDDDFGYDPLRRHLADSHDLPIAGIDIEPARLGNDGKIVDDRQAHHQAHRQAHQAGVAHVHDHDR